MFTSNSVPVRRVPAFEARGDAALRLDKMNKDLGTRDSRELVARALAVLEAISEIAGENGEVLVTNEQGRKMNLRVK